MKPGIEARLVKLEASTGSHRKVIIWESEPGGGEREIERLRAAGGSNDVEFVVVRWLRGGVEKSIDGI